ncbi:MAG: hypothetical protein F6K21_37205 [Symploca sp. SIO2D2]|nr:hypothetical protein [Symploca sp. SIO2D2]
MNTVFRIFGLLGRVLTRKPDRFAREGILWALPLMLCLTAAAEERSGPSFEEVESELLSPVGRGPKFDQFLADKGNSEGDRFKISDLAKRLEIRELMKDGEEPADRRSMLEKLERAAEELIEEYPDQPGGYGRLLAVAKGSSEFDAMRIASRIIESDAPENFKKGAERVMYRKDLVGKRLECEGLDLEKYSGKVVLLYTWDLENPPPSRIVTASILPADSFALVGLYLGDDLEEGLEAAAEQGLPGEQLCDGGGFDSGMAEELGLTMRSSVYIIGLDGKVIDVEGHRRLGFKLASLLQSPLADSDWFGGDS